MLMVMAMLRLEAARHAGLQLLLIQVLIAMTAVEAAIPALEVILHPQMVETKIVMEPLMKDLAVEALLVI